MTESILLDISDFREQVVIDNHFDETRFNSFVMRAQRNNLRDLFGQALYYDFFNDIANAKYVSLRDGASYTTGSETVQYYGLKPFLIYHTAVYITLENDTYMGNKGNHYFNNDPSEHRERISYKEKSGISQNYLSSAVYYQNDIVKYLNEKGTSVFPLWKGDSEEPITEYQSIVV